MPATGRGPQLCVPSSCTGFQAQWLTPPNPCVHGHVTWLVPITICASATPPEGAFRASLLDNFTVASSSDLDTRPPSYSSSDELPHSVDTAPTSYPPSARTLSSSCTAGASSRQYPPSVLPSPSVDAGSDTACGPSSSQMTLTSEGYLIMSALSSQDELAGDYAASVCADEGPKSTFELHPTLKENCKKQLARLRRLIRLVWVQLRRSLDPDSRHEVHSYVWESSDSGEAPSVPQGNTDIKSHISPFVAKPGPALRWSRKGWPGHGTSNVIRERDLKCLLVTDGDWPLDQRFRILSHGQTGSLVEPIHKPEPVYSKRDSSRSTDKLL